MYILEDWWDDFAQSASQEQKNIVLYFNTSYSLYYFYHWVEQQADNELTQNDEAQSSILDNESVFL